MLIIHNDTDILVALNEDDESLTGEHIKNGYPELLEDWQAGRIRATMLKGSPSRNDLVMDSGKPRLMTGEEIKARDTVIAAEISKKASTDKAAAELEVKIQAELRALALERLSEECEVIK